MDCIVEETFARLVPKACILDQTVTSRWSVLQRGLRSYIEFGLKILITIA